MEIFDLKEGKLVKANVATYLEYRGVTMNFMPEKRQDLAAIIEEVSEKRINLR